ncbi:hypothetical protein MRB53_041756 [Persea americana]|nr:hypothetical protein MRB53_041756 [Persea americana]
MFAVLQLYFALLTAAVILWDNTDAIASSMATNYSRNPEFLEDLKSKVTTSLSPMINLTLPLKLGFITATQRGPDYAILVKKPGANKGSCSRYKASSSGSVKMVVVSDDEPIYGYDEWSYNEKRTLVAAKATLRGYQYGTEVSSMVGENVETLQIPAVEGEVITACVELDGGVRGKVHLEMV